MKTVNIDECKNEVTINNLSFLCTTSSEKNEVEVVLCIHILGKKEKEYTEARLLHGSQFSSVHPLFGTCIIIMYLFTYHFFGSTVINFTLFYSSSFSFQSSYCICFHFFFSFLSLFLFPFQALYCCCCFFFKFSCFSSLLSFPFANLFF